MSHVDASPLAAYNSLMDPHLGGYFSNGKMRKHLRKSGLINRSGDIVTETTYRLNMARKEHKKHVRDLLAQAIVHKTLDMERNRQVEIRKKLEEIAKIELVRRVRTERGRKGDEEVLPYLAPRPKSAKSGQRSRPQSGKSGGRPKSAPGRGRSRGRSRSPGDEKIVIVDEDGMPLSPRSNSRSRSVSSDRSTPRRPKTSHGRSSKYPKGEIDDRHLYSLDQHALKEYTMARHSMERGGGMSPYLYQQLPRELQPSPPTSARPKSGKARGGSGKKQGGGGIQTDPRTGRQLRPKSNKGSLMLHRQEPAMKHQERIQTMCEVTIHYFGSNLKLDYEKFDPRDDIVIEQQHCGGNTLHVYKNKTLPGSCFTFTSRRHRGFPFGLTFYVNGIEDCRLSACCEYKHSKGSKLGGKKGHFGIVGIEGSAPCYKCQISEEMKESERKPRKQKKQSHRESREDVNVSVDEDKDKSTEKNKSSRSDVNVKGEGEQDQNNQHNESVEVPVEDEDTARKEKQDYSYDEDFDDDEPKKSDKDTGRASRSGRSRSTSGSRSRSSSRSSRSRSRSGSRSSSSSRSRSRSRDRASSSSPTTDTETETDRSNKKKAKPKTHNPQPPNQQSDNKLKQNESFETANESDANLQPARSCAPVKDSADESFVEKSEDSDKETQNKKKNDASVVEKSDDSDKETKNKKMEEFNPYTITFGSCAPAEDSADSSFVEKSDDSDKETHNKKIDKPSPASRIRRRTRSLSSHGYSPTSSSDQDIEEPRSRIRVHRKKKQIESRSKPEKKTTKKQDSPRVTMGTKADSPRISESKEEERPQQKPEIRRERDSSDEDNRVKVGLHSHGTHAASEHKSEPNRASDSDDSSNSSSSSSSSSGSRKKQPTSTEQVPESKQQRTDSPRQDRKSSDSGTDQTPVKREPSPPPREASPPASRGTPSPPPREPSPVATKVATPPVSPPAENKATPFQPRDKSSSSSSDDSLSSDSSSDSSDSDSDNDDRKSQVSTDSADAVKPTLVHRPYSKQMAFSIAKPTEPPVEAPKPGVNDSIRPQVESRVDVEVVDKTLTTAQIDELCECMKETGTISSLVLRNCWIDNEGIAKIAAVLEETAPSSDLRMLNLNNNMVDEIGLKSLLNVVTAKTDLKILLIHSNPLGDVGVTNLVQGLVQTHQFRQADEDRVSSEQLKSIHNAAQDLISEVMKDTMHNSSLHSVESNQSSDSGTKALVSASEKKAQGLTGLPLAQLELGDCGMTEKGAEQVADLISANTNIRTLSLTGNKKVGTTGWLAVADALRKNTHILSLSLDYNDLGDAGVAILAEALRDNTTLKELDLEGNKIGEEGARKLLEMLEDNNVIQDVSLFRGNNISDETLEKINTALKK